MPFKTFPNHWGKEIQVGVFAGGSITFSDGTMIVHGEGIHTRFGSPSEVQLLGDKPGYITSQYFDPHIARSIDVWVSHHHDDHVAEAP